jgi:hypothetical protein
LWAADGPPILGGGGGVVIGIVCSRSQISGSRRAASP